MSGPPPQLDSATLQSLLSSSSSTNNTKPHVLLSESSLDAVTNDENKTNSTRLLCPRKECKSTILLSDTATLVSREDNINVSHFWHSKFYNTHRNKVEPTPHPQLNKITSNQWWFIKGSPMSFENVGFTNSTGEVGPSGKPLKLLTCAECDVGPLGWCEEGGDGEYWMAVERVGYQTE
ncbi:Mss4-like protein [Flagelloscypha sp. PMI_526]|nr:Mss4-like protein [Flagelloscypha sp. PMI_526]